MKLFINPTLAQSSSVLSVDDCSCWLCNVWFACWEILADIRTRTNLPAPAVCTLCMQCRRHPLKRRTDRCTVYTYSMWQNGMSASHIMHKLQLKMWTGWVGSLRQRRTFTLGQMDDGEKKNTKMQTMTLLIECSTYTEVRQHVSVLSLYSACVYKPSQL